MADGGAAGYRGGPAVVGGEVGGHQREAVERRGVGQVGGEVGPQALRRGRRRAVPRTVAPAASSNWATTWRAMQPVAPVTSTVEAWASGE